MSGTTTLAVRSANSEPGISGGRDGEEPGPSSGASVKGGRRVAGLLAVAVTLALVLLFSPGLRSDLGGLTALLGNIGVAGIQDWVLSFGALSPVVYFLVVVGQVLVSPIPAGPVTLAGSLVFGVWEGLALSLAGSVAGSVVVFGAARRWGEALVVKLMGERTFRRYVAMLDARGWWVFVALLVPFVPDDAVVALAGLSALKFRRFLAIMVVGRIPGNATTALLASDWVTGSGATLIMAGIALVGILALGFAYRGRLETWILGRAEEAPDGLATASRQESTR